MSNKNDLSAYEMLEEIRGLLGLTIEAFAFEMGWANHRYYDYLKSGRVRDGRVIITQPSFNKIFDGINYALSNYEHWKNKKEEITFIVIKHVIKK